MQSMIEYGVSQNLRAEFDMLRETLSMHSYKHQQVSDSFSVVDDWQSKKYSSKTIDKLAQYVVCRNYGKVCLELAYLCWPIVRHQEYSKGVLSFFWIEESIRPQKFKQAMSTLATADLSFPNVSLNSNELQVSDGKRSFTINSSRVVLLSALLELMVSNIEGILDAIEMQLNSSDSKCVGTLASYLQKRLYEFLKLHLPTANLQQKYRYIHNWVSANTSNENLNDEQVLAFWQSAVNEEGYVKFQNALSDIIDYSFAYEQVSVQRELRFNFSLDDMNVNESSQLQDSVFELAKDDFGSPSWLMDMPKFVSKKEYQQVAFLLEVMAQVTQFPLSVLRAEVFGHWQNVIIQQTRSKKDQKTSKPDTTYAEYLTLLQTWRLHAANTLLCCSAILLEHKDIRCLRLLSLALGLMLEKDQSQSFNALVQRLVLSKTGSQLTFCDINRWILQSQTLSQFFALAKKTLAKNNKMGFKSADIAQLQSDELDVYERGGEQLHACTEVMLELCGIVMDRLPDIVSDTMPTQIPYKEPYKESDKVHSITKQTTKQTTALESFYLSDLFIFKSEFEKRHG